MIGVVIEGIGMLWLCVMGGGKFGGGEFCFVEDFYEIVMFFVFGVIMGGDIMVCNLLFEYFLLIDCMFVKFGVIVMYCDGWLCVECDGLLCVCWLFM